MKTREQLITDLQDGRAAIRIQPYLNETAVRRRLNHVLAFFAAPEMSTHYELAGKFITLCREPFKRLTSWCVQYKLPKSIYFVTLGEAYRIIFNDVAPSENYAPTIENLRKGLVAVQWEGTPPAGLIALIALAFPGDCISGLGYRPGPISNDPENDGEWDHIEDFEGPVYHISAFKKDFQQELSDITEEPKQRGGNTRHEMNKHLPFKQVETKPSNPEYFLQRGSHTGTQLAETISDFDERVRTVVREMLLQ